MNFVPPRVWRRAAGLSGSSIVAAALAIVASSMLAHHLGPGGMGQYQAIVRWTTTWLIVGSLGFGHASAYLASSADRRGLRSLVTNAILMSSVQSVALLLIAYIATPFVLHSNLPAVEAGRWYVLSLPVNVLALNLAHITRARLHFTTFNAYRVVQPLAFVVFLYSAASLGRASLLGACIAFVAASCMSLGVLAWNAQANGWLLGPVDRLALRTAFSYGIQAQGGIAARELNLYVDQLIISLVLPSAALGLYASAVSAAGALGLVSTAFLFLAQPEVQSVAEAHKVGHLWRLVGLCLLITIPVGAALAIIMPTAIGWIYGAAFLPATNVARVLCLAAVVEGIAVTLTGGLIALGRPFVMTIIQTSVLVLTVILLLIFLPIYGIMSAALISVFSYASAAAAMAIYVWRIRPTAQLAESGSGNPAVGRDEFLDELIP